MEAAQHSGEAGRGVLTMDNVEDLIIVVPHRLRFPVVIEPVVEQLVGGHLDTTVV